MTTGLAAIYIGPYHFELRELPVPEVEPGGILVRITAAGICGSDLHYYRGHLGPGNWTASHFIPCAMVVNDGHPERRRLHTPGPLLAYLGKWWLSMV